MALNFADILNSLNQTAQESVDTEVVDSVLQPPVGVFVGTLLSFTGKVAQSGAEAKNPNKYYVSNQSSFEFTAPTTPLVDLESAGRPNGFKAWTNIFIPVDKNGLDLKSPRFLAVLYTLSNAKQLKWIRKGKNASNETTYAITTEFARFVSQLDADKLQDELSQFDDEAITNNAVPVAVAVMQLDKISEMLAGAVAVCTLTTDKRSKTPRVNVSTIAEFEGTTPPAHDYREDFM